MVRQAAITDIEPLNAEPWTLGHLVPEQCRERDDPTDIRLIRIKSADYGALFDGSRDRPDAVDKLLRLYAELRPSLHPRHGKLMKQIIDQNKPFRELTSLSKAFEINNFVFSAGVID